MATREVHCVRLRAPSAALIQRGALLLEDALHTASLEDGGRLLVVRSLQCGPIQPRAGAATLALQIERRMRELAPSAVHVDTPAALQAPAVYFQDAVEPLVTLALCLARAESVVGWWWPLVVRGWHPGLPRAAALRLVLHRAAEAEHTVPAIAAIVQTLVQRGVVAPLLAALEPADGPLLLRAWGFAAPSPVLTPLPTARPVTLAPQWSDVVAVCADRWGTADTRTLWLALVALVADRPARMADSELLVRVQALVQRAAPPVAARADREAVAPPLPAAARAPVLVPLLAPPAPVAGGAENVPWSSVPARTGYAGLLFVLPVLVRLGIAANLAAHPTLVEWSLPERMLRRLALRLGAAPADPVLRALGDVVAAPLELDAWRAPDQWWSALPRHRPLVIGRCGDCRVLTVRHGRLPLAVWRGSLPDAIRASVGGFTIQRAPALAPVPLGRLLEDAWLGAARCWCRRVAGIGLHDLVVRPGRVAATPTHVDLLLDHRQVDLRVRRAGLDLDPGWLPWLGRVVRFHYLYGEQGL